MKFLLPFLFLFSVSALSNSDSLTLPDENAEILGDTELTSRSPRIDGCQIVLSFNGHQRFDNQQNARNFCDRFHNFFNVRNRCFVIHNQFANWDYSISFTGRGDNWGNARRNVHQQFIEFVFSRRFDQHRFDSNRRYSFTCDD